MDWEPEVALVPDQPPEAVQEVAFAEDQERLEAELYPTGLGLAVKVTVGGETGTYFHQRSTTLPAVKLTLALVPAM